MVEACKQHVDADPYPSFQFDAGPYPDPITHIFLDLDPPIFPNNLLGLPPFHFDADPDPAFHFDANPYPAFHFDVDPYPDLAAQNDADPDPQYRV